MNMIHVYETDFGLVRLPDDFPMAAVTKDGMPDRRFKIADDVARYFEDLTLVARQMWEKEDGAQYMDAMSFATWQKS